MNILSWIMPPGGVISSFTNVAFQYSTMMVLNFDLQQPASNEEYIWRTWGSQSKWLAKTWPEVLISHEKSENWNLGLMVYLLANIAPLQKFNLCIFLAKFRWLKSFTEILYGKLYMNTAKPNQEGC